MIRIMLVPAACLALTGAAAAGVSPPPAAPPAGTGLVRAATGRTVPGRLWLRGVEPETTSTIPAPSTRAPCPAGRRVGTGTGFCLIN